MQPFSEGFTKDTLVVGENVTDIDLSFDFAMRPRLMIRPLEAVNFRGSHMGPPVAGTLVSVPTVSNSESGFSIFDSARGFQPNRVTLESAMASDVLSFEDLKLDFSDLSAEWRQSSVAHCVSSDSWGTCLRCAHGFAFDNSRSKCEACGDFYIPLLGLCTSDASQTAAQSHELVTETIKVKEYKSDSQGVSVDVKYFSFFGALSAQASNSLVESLAPQNDRTYLYKLKLHYESKSNLENVPLPSQVYVQYPGFDYLFVQLADVVTLETANKVVCEFYVSFWPSPGGPSANYVLPLPNEKMLLDAKISVNLEATVVELGIDDLIQKRLDSGRSFLPIEAKTEQFFVEPFGPFHNVNEGPVSSQEGYIYYTFSNWGLSIKEPCHHGCDQCAAIYFCVSCFASFYKDSDSQSCVPCSAECLECQDHPEKCLKPADSAVQIDSCKQLEHILVFYQILK